MSQRDLLGFMRFVHREIPAIRVDIGTYERVSVEVEAMLARARRWPGFQEMERRIVAYMDAKTTGPIDILTLFKIYRRVRTLPATTRIQGAR